MKLLYILLLATVGPALAQTPATFAPVATYSTGAGSRPQNLAVADVNGDGRPDLLTANAGTGTAGVQLGTGTGTFGTVTSYSTGTGSTPVAISAADVNGDGKLDLLVASPAGGMVGVLPGTGTGSFGTVTTYSLGGTSNAQNLAVADVNGDGRPDLLTTNKASGTAGVQLGASSGTFGTVTSYSTGAGSTPVAIAVADLNGDGKPDLLTANELSNTVSVLTGTGAGTFGAAITYSTGPNSYPQSLAVADVNGDGQLDLLTANYTAFTAGVLLGTGSGTFGAVVSYSTGASKPYCIAVADVNADGKPDLLTTNSASNAASVLLGTGAGTFGAATAYSTGPASSPLGLAVADVNADGRPDLLTANFNDATGVLLNTTTLPTRAALPGTAATLHPNPATASATLTATGLPAAATQLAATLTDALGRPVRRLTVPATAGAATAAVPTAGLASGLYLLRLEALDAQGVGLGALPVQRLAVE